MANKRISELGARVPSTTDLMLVGDPTTGYSYKCTIAQAIGLANAVPYTGATQNVNLGEWGISLGYVSFDLTPTGTPASQGAVYWDASKSTLALIMNGTTQHIGQDQFYYVKNSTGSTIPKGTAVRFAGTNGASGHILIAPMIANGSFPSQYYMGVTSEEIVNGGFGQVMSFGELEGINTSSYTAGDILYVSTSVAGAFQTTAPVAPNNIIIAAAAINSKSNGAIQVRATLGSNINNDEGVKITSGTAGQLLQLQSNGLWENKSVASVMSGYVPYTGATTSVDLGTWSFSANNINVEGATNAGHLRFKQRNSAQLYQPGYTILLAQSSTDFIISYSQGGTDAKIIELDSALVTNNVSRNFSFPDKSGTFALLDDIPSLSGYVPYTGATANLNLGSYSLLGLNGTFEGNVRVGTVTGSLEVGYASAQGVHKLDVNGTARFAGALSGTSATFSGNAAFGTASFNNYGSTTVTIASTSTTNVGALVLRNSDSSVRGHLYSDGSGNKIVVGSATASSLELVTSDTTRLTIASTGAATFSSSITAASATIGSLSSGSNAILAFANNASGGTRNIYYSSTNATLNFTNTAGSDVFTITNGGNIGIGVTPSAWGGGYSGILELKNAGSAITSGDIGSIELWANSYYVSGGNKYANNGLASKYQTYQGAHYWFTAANNTGGSGASLSFTQAMTLDASGRLGIGTTSPQRRLHVATSMMLSSAGAAQEFLIGDDNVRYFAIQTPSGAANMQFNVYGGTNIMTLTSGGNVLIGTSTSGGSKLRIVGLPTSSSGLSAGDIWSDGGTLKIV